MKKNIFLIITLTLSISVFAQETAVDFFNSISEEYSKMEAYSAEFKFTSGSRGQIIQEGVLTYKSPNYLRLDYRSPAEQVLSVTPDKLSIYLPSERTFFEQKIKNEIIGDAGLGGLTPQGLALFRTNYSVSYLNSPALERLDSDFPEEVYKFRLFPRRPTEPFKSILISVTTDGYIRRIESLKRDDETIILDLWDIDTKVTIPNDFFDYTPPPTTTTLSDFLFTPGEDE